MLRMGWRVDGCSRFAFKAMIRKYINEANMLMIDTSTHTHMHIDAHAHTCTHTSIIGQRATKEGRNMERGEG